MFKTLMAEMLRITKANINNSENLISISKSNVKLDVSKPIKVTLQEDINFNENPKLSRSEFIASLSSAKKQRPSYDSIRHRVTLEEMPIGNKTPESEFAKSISIYVNKVKINKNLSVHSM